MRIVRPPAEGPRAPATGSPSQPRLGQPDRARGRLGAEIHAGQASELELEGVLGRGVEQRERAYDSGPGYGDPGRS
jgi:hypothetical protein